MRVRGPATRKALTGAMRGADRVLPAMKHAAEELRIQQQQQEGAQQQPGAQQGSSPPSLRQAARSANAVLQAGDDSAARVDALHAAAMKVPTATLIDAANI